MDACHKLSPVGKDPCSSHGEYIYILLDLNSCQSNFNGPSIEDMGMPGVPGSTQ